MCMTYSIFGTLLYELDTIYIIDLGIYIYIYIYIYVLGVLYMTATQVAWKVPCMWRLHFQAYCLHTSRVVQAPKKLRVYSVWGLVETWKSTNL